MTMISKVNSLPDDCLLTIFNHVNQLDDLISCLKVCVRWSRLITYRLSKVKYATVAQCTDYPPRSISIGRMDILKSTHFSELLPNIKILDIDFPHGEFEVRYKDMVTMNVSSIKGLIYPSCHIEPSVASCCQNLEMIATNFLEDHFCEYSRGSKLKQLYMREYTLNELKGVASFLPNLQRLHLDDIASDIHEPYDGPILQNLKILELTSGSYIGKEIFPGYYLIDCCPVLESAYFFIATKTFSLNVNIKNFNLRDLVLEHLSCDYSQNWSSLQSFLLKFPNLEHLAIRKSRAIRDIHIKELIQMLPCLNLIDVRGCPGITQDSVDYIKQNCDKKRSFSFYYDNRKSPREFPELNTPNHSVCIGFDFMKYCFFKHFYELPLLLDPNDDD